MNKEQTFTEYWKEGRDIGKEFSHSVNIPQVPPECQAQSTQREGAYVPQPPSWTWVATFQNTGPTKAEKKPMHC